MQIYKKNPGKNSLSKHSQDKPTKKCWRPAGVRNPPSECIATLRILAFGTDATIHWSRGLIVFPHLMLLVLLRLSTETRKAYLISLKKIYILRRGVFGDYRSHYAFVGCGTLWDRYRCYPVKRRCTYNDFSYPSNQFFPNLSLCKYTNNN